MPPFTHALAALTAVLCVLSAFVYGALAKRRTVRAAPLYCAGCALGAVLMAAYAVGGRR